ncbi:Uncharacterised protein [Moraxella lacunata]|jgi:hypothetical protein|uniref:Ribbon-helix-helix protein CopG domain-containing protein n=2 Tax=Moraxella lacunata TaxID=477 RepID=A0A378UCM5_MORLA|nr:Uncharacterised protein [Moraxella lacunata]
MPNLATSKPTKARTSIALDFEKKKAIEEIARQQNRTPHYVMIEMISKGIQEAQEQAEYEKWVEKRVMAVYDRVQKQGSNGKTSSQVFATLHEKMNQYANHQ